MYVSRNFYPCLIALLMMLFIPMFASANNSAPSKVLTAAVLKDFPPLYQVNNQNKPVGFAIDILEHVANQHNYQINYLVVENWAQAMNAIRTQKADLIPGIGISKARQREFLFTSVMETIPVSLFVRSSSNEFKSIDSLNAHRVAVIAKSAAYTRLQGRTNIELISFPNISSALFQLLAGNVDVFAFPQQVLLKKLKELKLEKQIKAVGDPVMELKRGFLVHHQNQALIDTLDPSIKAFVSSPDYLKTYQKWYGKAQAFWTVSLVFWTMLLATSVLLLLLLIWRYMTQKQINFQLSKNEALLKEAQSMAQLGNWEFYPIDKKIHLSDEAHHIIGLESLTEPHLLALFQIVYKPDRRKAINTMQKISGLQQCHSEIRIHRFDGQVRWLECQGQPVLNEQGQLTHFKGVVQDITERKHAEEKLQGSKAFLDSIINGISDPVFVKDSNHRWIALNDTMCKMMNRSRKELIGKSDYDVFSEEQAKVFWQQDDEVFNTNESQVYEEEVHLPTGIIHVSTLKSPFRNPISGEKNLVGSVRDITEIKNTELALRRTQKMEAVGQLTGGIAHDFNNILSIILGNLNLLKRQIRDNEQALERVDVIIKSSNRAVDLTKQLLSFSRQQTSQAFDSNLNTIIEDMDSLIHRSLSPEIEVLKELDDSIWTTKIDPGNFEDSLLNLLINARDALTGHGQITVKTENVSIDKVFCSKHSNAEPGDYVLLTISDNGRGMEPDVLEHIFEPFYTTKPLGKGTGLGLSMVFGFCQRSGGFILAESTPEQGTAMMMYLPRNLQHQVEVSSEEIEPKVTSQPLPKGDETVLVVEDEADLMALAGEFLSAQGYHVICAENGPEALQKLEQHPEIQLLFSDVLMPGGLNGYQLAVKANKIKPDLKVLLTSGYTQKAATEGSFEQNNFALLQKPYTEASLLEHVRAELDQGVVLN